MTRRSGQRWHCAKRAVARKRERGIAFSRSIEPGCNDGLALRPPQLSLCLHAELSRRIAGQLDTVSPETPSPDADKLYADT